MVHVSKPKKQKGDDAFEKKKQKVGRKKLAPATATKAEVHARTLRVNSAVPTTVGQPEQEAAQATKRPERSFREQLTGTTHYREGTRKSAFIGLSGFLTESTVSSTSGVSQVQQLQAMSASLEALTDTSPDVRTAAATTLQHTLKWMKRQSVISGAATSISGKQVPRADGQGTIVPEIALNTIQLFIHHAQITLTHAQLGVRKTGSELVSLFIRTWPGQLRRYFCCSVHDLAVLTTTSKTTSAASSSAATGTPAGTNTSAGQKRDTIESPSEEVQQVVEWLAHLAQGTKKFDVLAAVLAELVQVSVSAVVSPISSLSGEAGLTKNAVRSGTTIGLIEPHSIVTRHGSVSGGRAAQGGSNTATTASIVPFVKKLFEKYYGTWNMAWKEAMELRLAIFREPAVVSRACEVARCIALCSVTLMSPTDRKNVRETDGAQKMKNKNRETAGGDGGLSSKHLRSLRDTFISRLPITMKELATSTKADQHHLAQAVCLGLIPLAPHFADAQYAMETYFSSILSRYGGSNVTVPTTQSATIACSWSSCVDIFAQLLCVTVGVSKVKDISDTSLRPGERNTSTVLRLAKFAPQIAQFVTAECTDLSRVALQARDREKLRSNANTSSGGGVASQRDSHSPTEGETGRHQQIQLSMAGIMKSLEVVSAFFRMDLRAFSKKSAGSDTTHNSRRGTVGSKRTRSDKNYEDDDDGENSDEGEDNKNDVAHTTKSLPKLAADCERYLAKTLSCFPRLLFSLRHIHLLHQNEVSANSCSLTDTIVKEVLRILWGAFSQGHPSVFMLPAPTTAPSSSGKSSTDDAMQEGEDPAALGILTLATQLQSLFRLPPVPNAKDADPVSSSKTTTPVLHAVPMFQPGTIFAATPASHDIAVHLYYYMWAAWNSKTRTTSCVNGKGEATASHRALKPQLDDSPAEIEYGLRNLPVELFETETSSSNNSS